MFNTFWGSQEQDGQPLPQEIPTNSWYPSSLLRSSSSTQPTTPSSSSSSSFNVQRPEDRSQSAAQVSPSETAVIISLLKDRRWLKLHALSHTILARHTNPATLFLGILTRLANIPNLPEDQLCIDELRKLLADKDAYCQFLLSLDQVKIQKNLRDELRKETLLLARENLEKEPQIMELQNQCRIIRTTELAAAEEKLHELERQKEETLKFYSPSSLLRRLQETMNKTEGESEALHRQLLDGDIGVGPFLQKYKKLRNTYHRHALTHLAAKTSLTG